MNPVAYLQVAKMLATAGTDIPADVSDQSQRDLRSALIRSAASRAYYSVFLAAREVGVAIDYVMPPEGEGSSHVHLWKWLRDKDDRLARRCRTLKQFRQKADYDNAMEFEINPHDVVEQASEILEAFQVMYDEAMKTSPPRPSI